MSCVGARAFAGFEMLEHLVEEVPCDLPWGLKLSLLVTAGPKWRKNWGKTGRQPQLIPLVISAILRTRE